LNRIKIEPVGVNINNSSSIFERSTTNLDNDDGGGKKSEDNNINQDCRFYDDSVKGNCCWRHNYENKNINIDNYETKIEKGIKTSTRRSTMGLDDNSSVGQKLKRSCYEEGNCGDESNDHEGNNDNQHNYEEDSDDEENDEAFLPVSNNSLCNHQDEDLKPPAKKKSRQALYNDHCDKIWMDMFQKLVEYKNVHKDTEVPSQYKENPKLGKWVSQQRYCYFKKNLDMKPNRISLLDSINFVWKGKKRKEPWIEMFQKLLTYKRLHRNILVSRHYKENKKLGVWVKHQRRCHNNGRMQLNQIALLNSIGFDWNAEKDKDERWMEMFQKLVTYKGLYQNTLVPVKYKDDPQLGTWVVRQRQVFSKNKMLDERFNHLNSIGFVWRVNRSKKNLL